MRVLSLLVAPSILMFCIILLSTSYILAQDPDRLPGEGDTWDQMVISGCGAGRGEIPQAAEKGGTCHAAGLDLGVGVGARFLEGHRYRLKRLIQYLRAEYLKTSLEQTRNSSPRSF